MKLAIIPLLLIGLTLTHNSPQEFERHALEVKTQLDKLNKEWARIRKVCPHSKTRIEWEGLGEGLAFEYRVCNICGKWLDK